MEKNIFFRALSAMVSAVFFMAVVINFGACTQAEVEGEMPTLTSVDSIEVVKNDTVVIDKDWTMNIVRINKGDTLDITVEMENPEEKDTLHAQAVIWKQKNGYQIFENQLILTPEYANAGMSGGLISKENITDAGWDDVITLSYPTEDDNIIFVKVRIEHHRNRPFLRLNTSKIISLAAMGTRALYKVADAPVKADDLLSFETEGFKEDTSFDETISTPIDRDLMAEDDIAGAKEVSHDFEVIDETTDRMWIIERFTMKSGKTNDVERSFLRQRWQKNIDPYELFVESFSYANRANPVGMSVFEAEKSITDRGNENWAGKYKVDMYNADINGEKPVRTKYTFYTETWTYKDKYITVNFPYVPFEVTESETAVKGATSDKANYNKAILFNPIDTKYATYKSSMSEEVYLYSKVERKVVDHGFKLNTKKRTWETNRMTPSVVHYRLWNDGVEETTTHEWPLSRALTNGPAFEKICKDNYNRTGNPSITSIKDTDKAFTDDNGGKWTCVEQNGTIGANVEFNGAENASVTWKFTEHNKVRLEVDGDVIEWGDNSYNFTLKPSLGEGSVKDGYTVYPYTGKLNYIFADAPAKESTDNGVIKVKKEKVLKKKGFEKEIVWGVTSNTYKATYFEEYDDNTKDEVSFSWVRPSTLTNGPAFERIASDNTNNTSEPKMTTKTSSDSYTEKNGGVWTGIVETSTISSTVNFNGAKSADVLFYATETNDVKLEYKGEVCDFGHFTYSCNLTPKLGAGSVSGDYTVYPYTAKLNYKFGEAAAKQATDKGSILVEEKTFFPKEWGKLRSVAQTTTISENTKKWDYVWSLHFYNENTKKYFVLPVILTYASPDVPVWNFSYVEECDKKSYDLYNSAYYYNGVKNAVAEDNREWMQWSIAATGSEKLAYGTIKYRTAADKAWDWESAVNGRATVFTHRYELKVVDGRLFVKDTYNGKNVTDSHCVNGGWK